MLLAVACLPSRVLHLDVWRIQSEKPCRQLVKSLSELARRHHGVIIIITIIIVIISSSSRNSSSSSSSSRSSGGLQSGLLSQDQRAII